MAFHSALVNVVREISFELYKVTTAFNPTSVFSNVDLNLATYVDDDDSTVIIRGGNFFDWRLNQKTRRFSSSLRTVE